MNFTVRTDLNINNDILENIFVELADKPAKKLNTLIGLIYRPPNTDVELFNIHIGELLSKINNERKICYLMGDFNVDIMKYDAHKATNDFLNSMYSMSFMSLISRPTRITPNSATLIDNIFL